MRKTHKSHPYEVPCPKCGKLAENDPMVISGSHVCEPAPRLTVTEAMSLVSQGYRISGPEGVEVTPNPDGKSWTFKLKATIIAPTGRQRTSWRLKG